MCAAISYVAESNVFSPADPNLKYWADLVSNLDTHEGPMSRISLDGKSCSLLNESNLLLPKRVSDIRTALKPTLLLTCSCSENETNASRYAFFQRDCNLVQPSFDPSKYGN